MIQTKPSTPSVSTPFRKACAAENYWWSRVASVPSGSWLSHVRDASWDQEIRLPHAWVATLNVQLKRRMSEFYDFNSRMQSRPSYRHAPASAEIIARQYPRQLEVNALRLTVTKLSEELRLSRAREERAQFLAYHDDLTGLPNRRNFLERLGKVLKCQDPDIAVFILDLDGFKALNDAQGHAKGDLILQAVAARLARLLNTQDFVSRLSGDEFACLINERDRHSLQNKAFNMCQAVAQPFTVNSAKLAVTASIGVAVSPHDGESVATLMEAADDAMYLAKRMRSQICFSSDRPRR